MKFKVTVNIERSRDQVIELFDSTENLKVWQPTLLSFEHVSGTPGQVGAKSVLTYKTGKRKTELVETITERDLPDRFSAIYEAKGIWNEINNAFTQTESGHTHWEMDCDFKCTGFMKLWMTLFPGMFKRQALKDMNRFKAFAEGREIV